jgi:hypothetical protein
MIAMTGAPKITTTTLPIRNGIPDMSVLNVKAAIK